MSVYVLDEPSAGLHPADTEALLRALDRLKAAAIRFSSSSMSWMSCVMRTGWWMSAPVPASTAAKSFTAVRYPD